jgi:DNA-binding NtrC family response regulator
MDFLNDDSFKKKQVNIMLIDDEEYLVKLWKRVMERQGYRVTGFIRGLQALEEFKAKPDYYDIVVTDHSMPEITGYQLIEEILKIRNDMKIILCSGYLGEIEITVKKLDIDILLKPFDSITLLKTIKRNLIL